MSTRVQTPMQAALKPAVLPTRTGLLQRKCACGGAAGLDEECEECRAKQPPLRRRPAGQTAPVVAPPIVNDVLRSPGQPFDVATRAVMDSRFGHDFSNVRVHTDARAADSARAVNALAYAVGRDVVFAIGRYAPHTPEGRKLLAHELAHVLQHDCAGHGPPASIEVGSATDPSEAAADQAADQVLNGVAPDVTPRASMLRRQPSTDDPNRNVGPPLQPVPLPPRCGLKWKDGKWKVWCEDLPVPSPLPKSPEIPILPKDWPKPGDLIPGGGGVKGQADCRGFPGFQPGGSKEFMGQCCRGVESKENCCPPGRIAFKDLRCCKDDEVVQDGQCTKSSTLPPITLCLPQQKTLDGRCCTPPLVPDGLNCVPPPVTPPTPAPQPGALPPPGSVEIFFEKDRPRPGQLGGDLTVLSADGRGDLPGLAATLAKDPTLKVQLIGSCSSEGSEEYNYALGQRRAEWLASQLGLDASRLTDPPKNDLRGECRSVRGGVVTCGEAGAKDPPEPHDRRVLVRFFRPVSP